MSEFSPSVFAPACRRAAGCAGRRSRLLHGLVFLGLSAAGAALAGEQTPVTNSKANAAPSSFAPLPVVPEPVTQSPVDLSLPTLSGIPLYSSTEFRPRKRTVMDNDPGVSTFSDTTMINSTTVWQRLSDYKSHDRVQVLTLWQTGGSSVSLQAGRHGDPSLQWTSRLMNHGGSTQGLLDRLFSVSIAGATNRFRNDSRSTSTPTSPKPATSPIPAAVAASK